VAILHAIDAWSKAMSRRVPVPRAPHRPRQGQRRDGGA